jgi:hypothetical protein
VLHTKLLRNMQLRLHSIVGASELCDKPRFVTVLWTKSCAMMKGIWHGWNFIICQLALAFVYRIMLAYTTSRFNIHWEWERECYVSHRAHAQPLRLHEFLASAIPSIVYGVWAHTHSQHTTLLIQDTWHDRATYKDAYLQIVVVSQTPKVLAF